MWALGLNTSDCTTSGLSLDSSAEGERGTRGACNIVSGEFWERSLGHWRPRFSSSSHSDQENKQHMCVSVYLSPSLGMGVRVYVFVCVLVSFHFPVP